MGYVTAASIGWREDDLTLGVANAMRRVRRVILRTARCGGAEWLQREGIPFTSLDGLFDQADDYDQLIAMTVDAVLDAANEGDVLYCVNDPCDASLQALAGMAGERLRHIGGVMPGAALLCCSAGGAMVFSAIDCPSAHIDPSVGYLIKELDDRFLASDVKLRLMEHYPDEWPVYVQQPGGDRVTIPLCELDQLETYDHRLCVMVPPISDTAAWNRPTLHDLLDDAVHGAAMLDVPNDAGDLSDQCQRDGQALGDIALRARQAANMGDYDFTDVIAAARRHVRGKCQF